MTVTEMLAIRDSRPCAKMKEGNTYVFVYWWNDIEPEVMSGKLVDANVVDFRFDLDDGNAVSINPRYIKDMVEI